MLIREPGWNASEQRTRQRRKRRSERPRAGKKIIQTRGGSWRVSSGEQSTIRRKEEGRGTGRLRRNKKSMKREKAGRRRDASSCSYVEDSRRPDRERRNVYAVQRIFSGVDGGGSILSFMQGKSTLRKAKCYSRIVLADPFTYI